MTWKTGIMLMMCRMERPQLDSQISEGFCGAAFKKKTFFTCKLNIVDLESPRWQILRIRLHFELEGIITGLGRHTRASSEQATVLKIKV